MSPRKGFSYMYQVSQKNASQQGDYLLLKKRFFGTPCIFRFYNRKTVFAKYPYLHNITFDRGMLFNINN